MDQEHIQKIKDLFPCQTEFCSAHLVSLIKEAVATLGLQLTLSLQEQWKILAQKLNTRSKLISLADKNHRLLLIKFIEYEAANQYKSSYFNRAKINTEYIKSFELIGPYNFSEVITIVNKLKLIKKYYVDQPNQMECEDHLKFKIKEILNSCSSNKRTENSNYHKFMKIVEFQDRQTLINELSKILRLAWSKEKSKIKSNQNKVVVPSTHNTSQLKVKEIKPIEGNSKSSQEGDFNISDYFAYEFKNDSSSFELENLLQI